MAVFSRSLDRYERESSSSSQLFSQSDDSEIQKLADQSARCPEDRHDRGCRVGVAIESLVPKLSNRVGIGANPDVSKVDGVQPRDNLIVSVLVDVHPDEWVEVDDDEWPEAPDDECLAAEPPHDLGPQTPRPLQLSLPQSFELNVLRPQLVSCELAVGGVSVSGGSDVTATITQPDDDADIDETPSNPTPSLFCVSSNGRARAAAVSVSAVQGVLMFAGSSVRFSMVVFMKSPSPSAFMRNQP
jgi:hypothetical protein